MKIKAIIEIELDDRLADFADAEERDWVENEIIYDDELQVHARELGDIIGSIANIEILEWIEEEINNE